MNESTIFRYSNNLGTITFAFGSSFWITDFDGLSETDIEISDSRGAGQIGASIASQSVPPRHPTLDGVLFDPVKENRELLLRVFAPQVPSKLEVIDNGETWYLNVVPTRTPRIEPGNGVQGFQIHLYAEYPYWLSSKTLQTQLSGLTPLFQFPFYTGGAWQLSKFADRYFFSVPSKGNVPHGFKIVFTARGEVYYPEFMMMDTEEIVKLEIVMHAAETIEVDTTYGVRTVTKRLPSGITYNAFDTLTVESSLEMTLKPGDNMVRIDAYSGRERLGVQIVSPEGAKSGV